MIKPGLRIFREFVVLATLFVFLGGCASQHMQNDSSNDLISRIRQNPKEGKIEAGVIETQNIEWEGRKVEVKKGELMLIFKNDITFVVRKQIYSKYGLKEKEYLEIADSYVVEVVDSSKIEEVLSALRTEPSIKYVCPSVLGRLLVFSVPNDQYYRGFDGVKRQYYISTIYIDSAWNDQRIYYSKGSVDSRVAVLDSGVNYHHIDLDNKILRKDGSVVGYDFINSDSDPMDDHSHGTRVSGVLAAETGNVVCVAGVAWKPLVIPIKVATLSGQVSADAVIKGLQFAKDNGAGVVNMSFTVANISPINIALHRIAEDGIMLVAASGNDGLPVDFPACHDDSIAVGSVGPDDVFTHVLTGHWWSSNYGHKQTGVLHPAKK